MYFSDKFNVSDDILKAENVFNISLVSDLPLFIDPFLIFESKKSEYERLHADIIQYVSFVRDKVLAGTITSAQNEEWLYFPEVPQNWLGYSIGSNAGRGLGKKFSCGATLGLKGPVQDFGNETVSKGSHIERIFLFANGSGKDALSDFITNLCKKFLLDFTQKFAKTHLDPNFCREIHVRRVRFDFETERWCSEKFFLPVFGTQYVLLTPLDLLTQSIPWINRKELFDKFGGILDSMSDYQLRGRVNDFLMQRLAPPPNYPPGKEYSPKKSDVVSAKEDALLQYPEIANWYIAQKELDGEQAVNQSSRRVTRASEIYHSRIIHFLSQTLQPRGFFDIDVSDTKRLLNVFAQSIEEGGDKLFLTEDVLIHDLSNTDVTLICVLAWRADGNKSRKIPRFQFVSDKSSTTRFESKSHSGSEKLGMLVITTDRAKKSRVNLVIESENLENALAASITGVNERVVSMESVFISFTKMDKEWARWIGGVLQAAGYSVTVQHKDFLPGTNFVHEMDKAVKNTDRTIAVLSHSYLKSDFATVEWQAAFREDPLGESRKLVPVRVEKVNPRGLLGSIVYADLVGLSEPSAKAVLLGAMGAENRPKEDETIPAFPGILAGHENFDAFLTTLPIMTRVSGQSADVTKRLELGQKITNLATNKVNLLVYALEPPENEIPPISAAAKDRATALLDWCFRDGVNIEVIESLLETLGYANILQLVFLSHCSLCGGNFRDGSGQ